VSWGASSYDLKYPKLYLALNSLIEYDHKFLSYYRQIKSVSLGPIILNLARPQQNLDSASFLLATYKRILPQRRAMAKPFKRFIRLFALSFYQSFVPKLKHEDLLTPEEWIDQCSNYSNKKKNQFKKILKDLAEVNPEIKSFQKAEAYNELAKYLRLINPRSDDCKALLGPIIKSMEKVYYKDMWFVIKKIPGFNRIPFIEQNVQGHGKVSLSDFSSFESHFDEDIMTAIDFALVKHMYSDVYEGKISKMLTILTNNTLKSQTLKATFKYIRQSGEVNTALFNTNASPIMMCALRYLTDKCGENATDAQLLTEMSRFRIQPLYQSDFKLVAEGDDILMRQPTPLSANALKLSGFDLKLDYYNETSEAPFISMVYDECVQDLLYDPKKFLCDLGWIDAKYRNVSTKGKSNKLHILLVGKCLSFLHAYPNCPVIAPTARHYIHMLGKTVIRKAKTYFAAHSVFSEYKQKFLMHVIDKDLPATEIKYASRLKMESVFDLPISVQKRIEKDVLATTNTGALNLPYLLDHFPNDWFKYSTEYTKPATQDELRTGLIVSPRGPMDPLENLPVNVTCFRQPGTNKTLLWAQ